MLENVAFGPKMRGVGKAEREKIAHEYLALAKLTEAAGRYPDELSGGMQQRVGVVRALANEPDVLLMDEPFASVDAQTRMTLQEELTRIWQEKRPTVIFITHDVAKPCFSPIGWWRCPRGACWRRSTSTCRGRARGTTLQRGRAVQGADRARPSTRAIGLNHVARRPQIAKDAYPAGGGGCYLGWQLWLTDRGAAQDRGLCKRPEKVNILITLPFPPERFHVQLFQTYGRVSGTQENAVEVRGVKRADLDDRRPQLLGHARRAASTRRMTEMRRLAMLSLLP